MKSKYAHSVINKLFGALLSGKEITTAEIEKTIDEIMETVTVVASEYGKRVSSGG